jgi:hypothetical protein
MKRSQLNHYLTAAQACFTAHGWALPPKPRWDACDFGHGDLAREGLILINLAEEPEYCEKLMYAQKGMLTLQHCHRQKKEDIICRWGRLRIRCWPSANGAGNVTLKVTGEPRTVAAGAPIDLAAGERVTLEPGVFHEFVPLSDECIIGEVSTANNDVDDNVFAQAGIARFPTIIEDAPVTIRLLSERGA